MKMAGFLVFILSSAFSGKAQALLYGPSFCNYHPGACDSPLGGPFVCAPEVVEGNLKATDRVLTELSQTPDFANAKKFKSEVVRIQKLSPDDRVNEYLKEAGINPQSEDEIVRFIGERGPQEKNVAALKAHMGLSDQQAQVVIQRLTQALAGNEQ